MKKLKKYLFLNEIKMVQIIFFIVSMLILFTVYLFSLQAVKNHYINKLEIVSDDYIMTEVENVIFQENKLHLLGWGLRLNSENEAITLILRDVDRNEERDIILKTTISENAIVENYYSTNWSFGNCGFDAEVDINKIENNVCYEILLVHSYFEEVEKRGVLEKVKSTKKISTQQYLYNGNLYRYNPTEFWGPEIEDTEVQEALQQGVLLYYDLESEVWFYEWNSSLYYVIRFDWFGNYECKPEVPFFIYTTQTELLSEKEQESGRQYFGDYLSEEDYVDSTNKRYYVGSCKLPEKYVITYIHSGPYQNRGNNAGWQKKCTLKFDMFANSKTLN